MLPQSLIVQAASELALQLVFPEAFRAVTKMPFNFQVVPGKEYGAEVIFCYMN